MDQTSAPASAPVSTPGHVLTLAPASAPASAQAPAPAPAPAIKCTYNYNCYCKSCCEEYDYEELKSQNPAN